MLHSALCVPFCRWHCFAVDAARTVSAAACVLVCRVAAVDVGVAGAADCLAVVTRCRCDAGAAASCGCLVRIAEPAQATSGVVDVGSDLILLAV